MMIIFIIVVVMSNVLPVFLVFNIIQRYHKYDYFDMLGIVSKIRSIVISKLKPINKLSFPMKSPEKQRFSDGFRENKSLLIVLIYL